MRVLLTGATGFIGQHLFCELQIKTDWEIWFVSRNPSFSWPIWIRMDLTNPVFDSIKEFPTFDVIYHLAVDYSSPQKSFEILLNTLKYFKCKKFIFASSVEAVGVDQMLNRNEDSIYGYHTNEYGKMKLLCEDILQIMYPEVQPIILRIGNVYGEGSLNFVYPLLCEASQDIETYISPIYVKDVTNALINIVRKDIKPGIYNLVDNPFTIVSEWAKQIQNFGYKYNRTYTDVIFNVLNYLQEGNRSHSGAYLASLIEEYRSTLLLEGTQKVLKWLEQEKYIKK